MVTRPLVAGEAGSRRPFRICHKDHSTVRTRLAGILVAGLAIAGSAIGVAPSLSYGQAVATPAQPKPAVKRTHVRRHVRATNNAPGVPLPRQKPGAKKSE